MNRRFGKVGQRGECKAVPADGRDIEANRDRMIGRDDRAADIELIAQADAGAIGREMTRRAQISSPLDRPMV